MLLLDPPGLLSPPTSLHQSERGAIFISTLLVLLVLLTIGGGGLFLSRTDLQTSRNLLISTQALWLARAGTESGKNWLERNLFTTPLPVTLGPETLANGTYTVDIAALGNGDYRLTAIGLGLEASRHVVEEIVHVPDFAPLGTITSDGDGLHPDFDDESGGTGRRIPDFSVDGRNHAPDGSLAPSCPAVSPFAMAQAGAHSDLVAAVHTLKREIVIRANSFCNANGDSVAGRCTPGLFWVRGSHVSPRFTGMPCAATAPNCFLHLDLSAPALRATGLPLDTHLPAPPENRGPFTPGTGSASFVRSLTTPEQTRLQQALDTIVQRATRLPTDTILTLSTSLTSGIHTYGTPAEPRVTQVEEGNGALDLNGRAVVRGTGVLIIPRVVRLRNATLDWQGIVLIVGSGDLRVEGPVACGQITGAVVIRDDTTPDRKFDLDRVQRHVGCSPFSVNYSCGAVAQSLTTLMQTVSWTEALNT